MESNERASFVRWQGRTITQFGFVTNLLLGLATGELAILLGVALDRREGLTATSHAVILVSLILLAGSVVLGCWLALNRLASFRTTAQVARQREKNVIEDLDRLRTRTKRLDETSWWLLRAQVVLFATGTVLLAAVAFSLVAGRVYVEPPNQSLGQTRSQDGYPAQPHRRQASGMLRVHLSDIDWQSIGAIATLAAVIVALLPIWREARRRAAHARSLRLRLCSKLTILRPSLGKVLQGGHARHAAAILSKEEFRETVRSVAVMLQESSVLKSDEQDLIGIVLANLELAVGLYQASDFSAESATNILDLIDRAVFVMGKHGLLHGHVDKPWDDETKEQSGPAA